MMDRTPNRIELVRGSAVRWFRFVIERAIEHEPAGDLPLRQDRPAEAVEGTRRQALAQLASGREDSRVLSSPIAAVRSVDARLASSCAKASGAEPTARSAASAGKAPSPARTARDADPQPGCPGRETWPGLGARGLALFHSASGETPLATSRRTALAPTRPNCGMTRHEPATAPGDVSRTLARARPESPLTRPRRS